MDTNDILTKLLGSRVFRTRYSKTTFEIIFMWEGSFKGDLSSEYEIVGEGQEM